MKWKIIIRLYPLIVMGLLLLSTNACKKNDDIKDDNNNGNNVPALETVTDIDGNVYHTVTIGTQTWMIENLKTTKYNDGSLIPLVTNGNAWSSLVTPGYCWYDNDEATYKNLYGALYNWYTVNTGNLCPTGWHVPTDSEWKELEVHLGMMQIQADTIGWRGTNQGSKLAGIDSLWTNGTLIWDSEFGTSGFTALPGGWRYHNLGQFNGIGGEGHWWSSTGYSSTNAWGRLLYSGKSEVKRGYGPLEEGYSIRCIKD
ncbi:fibrobacter succinogenes major paralogous domain-containing protein [candidate division KSB1 bacterium]